MYGTWLQCMVYMTTIYGTWLQYMVHDYNVWYTWLQGMVHDYNVWYTWLQGMVHDYNVWYMTTRYGTWIQCMVHDYKVWYMATMYGTWLQGMVHDYNVWYTWLQCMVYMTTRYGIHDYKVWYTWLQCMVYMATRYGIHDYKALPSVPSRKAIKCTTTQGALNGESGQPWVWHKWRMTAWGGWTWVGAHAYVSGPICRVGQNRICTPYMPYIWWFLCHECHIYTVYISVLCTWRLTG